jgi:lysophospholipase L1-like esterase
MAVLPVSVWAARNSVFAASGFSLFQGGASSVIEAASLGDSIVANAHALAPNYAHSMRGPWHWANFLLRAPLRFRLGTQQGTAGETSAQILARVSGITSLTPVPRYCFVMAGNNDINSSVSPATAAANIEGIINALNAKGIIAVIGPVFPRDAWSAGQLTDMSTLNTSISAMAGAGRMVFADYRSAIIDGGTGYTLANVLFDGTHPGNYGAWLMSAAYVAALDPLIQTTARLTTPTEPTNKFSNGTLAGSTAPGGAWTGSIASPGYSNYSVGTPLGGTRVAAKVARADANGEWQQFALTDTTFAGQWSGGFRQTVTPSSVGMTEGETYEITLDAEVDGSTANLQGIGGQIIYDDGAASTQHNIVWYAGANATSLIPYPGTTAMVLRFPPFTMRADNGTDALTVRIFLSGQGDVGAGITGTARVGRLTLRKI